MIIKHPSDTRQVPGKASQFTGLALGDAVMPSTDGVVINTVSFAPGARTHWHEHEAGQLLIALSGYGLICTYGDTPRPLRTGSWVWVPPGERHWHGAAPDAFFVHTAVSFGATRWGDPVSTVDYEKPIEGNHHDH
jgi:quercetin dioxygenase-like cupin family protein